jgi:hypothetical protein
MNVAFSIRMIHITAKPLHPHSGRLRGMTWAAAAAPQTAPCKMS